MRIEWVYRFVVKGLLLLALSMLALGGFTLFLGLSLAIKFIWIGLWILISIPLVPILTLFISSLVKGDVVLILVSVVVVGIIIANLFLYGFGGVP